MLCEVNFDKRQKRTQCYDIMRTQCTLLFWGRLDAADATMPSGLMMIKNTTHLYHKTVDIPLDLE